MCFFLICLFVIFQDEIEPGKAEPVKEEAWLLIQGVLIVDY